MQQTIHLEGRDIAIDLTNGQKERHTFASEAEAAARFKFISESMEWLGTPFRDCADIKGRNGGVDCAMLLVRCAVDTGIIPPFDPRPYPARWHLHQDRERFLEWIETYLGGCVVETPQIGDVAVYQFGRCFSHGAIIINSGEAIHAYYAAQCCLLSRLDEPLLATLPGTGGKPRPVRYYDLWTGLKA
jgi:cell wall-associated NlpC family hydrolase